ncbi:MAG TPA: DedA family protein [Longimicrobiaceae bacterium]|nr:DedA family protein [Longimicrobiaceae bacterium]
MELIRQFVDLFLHLDAHLDTIVRQYGAWTYAILFLIIFAETGLVVTPFLPGDSLLFAAGALAANGSMNVYFLALLLFAAAVIGDSVNYSIGARLGVRVFKEDARVLKTEYLRRTEKFYEKYGGKTIVLARFVPIVRTYAPFVAGCSRMHYPRFLAYNVLGGFIWVALFVFGGYFFGNIPFVQENFGLVVIVIILLSILPAIAEIVKHRYGNPDRV